MDSPLLLSTAFLPPAAYISAIAQSEIVLIDGTERYQKQSYRNRAIILSGNGPLALTVPVRKCSPSTPISKVYIDYKTPWQRSHWRSLTAAYNNSAYFLYYEDYFHPFFTNKSETLLEYNTQLLLLILKLLHIKTSVQILTENDSIQTNAIIDYREKIHPKREIPLEISLQSSYHQVFEEKIPFTANMSIVDLLFNEGEYGKRIFAK